MKIEKISKSKNKKPSDGYIKGTGFSVIDNALEETRGSMVYQENIMQLFADVCDIPFGGADNIRRIVSKKLKEGETLSPKDLTLIADSKKQWEDGCNKYAIPRVIAEEWWNKIVASAGYGFNLSHAVAYSVLTYKTLWYKYNFPAQFIAARLNAEPSEIDFWLTKCVELNVEIVPPHVNFSEKKFIADGNKLYLSLNFVDRLGEVAADAIIKHRPYVSLSDFREKLTSRELNSTLAHSLYMIGSLDNIDGNYEDLDTGREVVVSGNNIKVTETKGKKREWIYRSKLDLFIDFLGGTILYNPIITKKIQELTQDGWRFGLVKKITDGKTASGKDKKEIYLSDSKFPDLYIGDWQLRDVYSALGKDLEINMFIAYKVNQEFGKFLLTKNGTFIQDLTDYIG